MKSFLKNGHIPINFKQVAGLNFKKRNQCQIKSYPRCTCVSCARDAEARAR